MTIPTNLVEIIFGIIFSIPGVILVLCSLFSLRNTMRKLRQWKRATGMVVGYAEIKTNAAKTSSYLPQVQFTTEDGQSLTFTSNQGNGKKRYSDGATVKVLYDAEDPARATIQSFSDLFSLPIILMFMGGVFAGIGYYNIFCTAQK